MVNEHIGFIGAGKITSALIKGFIEAKAVSAKHILVSNRSREKLEALKRYGIVIAKDNKEVVQKSDIIILAVKPKDIRDVLRGIHSLVQGKLMVSLCAGISIGSIDREIGEARIIRVMPNVNCLVQHMAGAYTANKLVSAEDKKTIATLFSSCGTLVYVEEKHMDAVTALSGSGPAFIATFMNNLADAAVQQGLSRGVAETLALETLYGTAKYLKEENISNSELVAMVASKGGTTEAGLKEMEKKKLGGIIDAAVQRAKEMNKDE